MGSLVFAGGGNGKVVVGRGGVGHGRENEWPLMNELQARVAQIYLVKQPLCGEPREVCGYAHSHT